MCIVRIFRIYTFVMIAFLTRFLILIERYKIINVDSKYRGE